MNIIAIYQIIVAILITINGADGVIIHAPNSNWTRLLAKIWLKGTQNMENYLPDTTFNDYYRIRVPGGDALSGRRLIKQLIEAQYKKERNQKNVSTGFLSDYDKYISFVKSNHDVDYKSRPGPGLPLPIRTSERKNYNFRQEGKVRYYNDAKESENDFLVKKIQPIKEGETEESGFEKARVKLGNLGMSILRAFGRRNTETEEPHLHVSHATKLALQEHDKKVKEISDFLMTRYQTAKYIYSEIERINRTNVIKDNLRTMVEHLEKPIMKHVKKQVMKCFYKAKKEENLSGVDHWTKHNPNSLIIKTMANAYDT